MSEIQKQFHFSRLIAKLILYAIETGYGVTLGEAYRSPETAEFYAKTGRGIKNSLHRRRLAMDLNLFKDGQYLTLTSDYKPIGEKWKSFSCDFYTCCWGGDFEGTIQDGNHFSITHLGIK